MQKMTFIFKYLQYWFRSTTSYGVHTPFLFDLITRVFENKSVDLGCLEVEALKYQQVKDKRIITVTDLGAGTSSGQGKERRIGFVAKSSSKSKKFGRLLFRLVNYYRPSAVLELGSSLGFSTAYLALGNLSSNVITIEGCPNIAKLAQSNFEKLNIQNIQLVIGDFNEKLPAILNDLPRIDFVFIDGNHQYEPTIKYFEQCLPKAVNDTIFVIDDIHWSEGMESAWKYICNHPSVTLSVDIFFMGVVFVRKELTKQHFIIRF